MAPNPAELVKPGGSLSNANEPVIHVIPKEFYGAAVPAKHVVQAAAAPVAVAPAPTPAPAKAKGGNGGLIAVVVVLLMLLVGGAGASYYFLVLKKQTVKPAPVVCGDNACNGTETYASCSADCPAPAPVCGDNACNGTETYASCSADCPAPAPVCGDSKCEGSESYTSCPSDCPAPQPVCGDGKCEEGKEDLVSCPGDCRPPTPIAGQDIDSDGLTDLEETQIYGSDARNADSDNDTYVDLNELVNLYNPARPLPSMLKDNPGITSYENTKQSYTVYRPTSWSVRDGDDVKSEVHFIAPDGESIQILVQPKPADKSLLDWYLGQAPGMKPSEVTVFKTRQGHEALQSPDKMTAFINVGNRVIVLTYNLAKDNVMQYRATFLMMVQSLKAQPVSEVLMPAEKPSEETATAPAP
jgi:hypothetical protein